MASKYDRKYAKRWSFVYKATVCKIRWNRVNKVAVTKAIGCKQDDHVCKWQKRMSKDDQV